MRSREQKHIINVGKKQIFIFYVILYSLWASQKEAVSKGFGEQKMFIPIQISHIKWILKEEGIHRKSEKGFECVLFKYFLWAEHCASFVSVEIFLMSHDSVKLHVLHERCSFCLNNIWSCNTQQ